MDYAVWNTLHDGTIVSIDGTVPGNIKVQISIAYLCAELPTESDSVVVHLHGCSQYTFQPFEGEPTQVLTAIAAREVEILSVIPEDGFATVNCVSGLLKVAYQDSKTYTAEGRFVAQADLEAAADRYWTRWSENAKRLRGESQ